MSLEKETSTVNSSSSAHDGAPVLPEGIGEGAEVAFVAFSKVAIEGARVKFVAFSIVAMEGANEKGSVAFSSPGATLEGATVMKGAGVCGTTGRDGAGTGTNVVSFPTTVLLEGS